MEDKNKKTEESKGLFSGISGVLKKLAYKSEFVEDEEESNGDKNNIKEAPTVVATQKNIEKIANPITKNQNVVLSVQPGAADVAAMNDVIINYIETINQPGIDFFEVWNAAADMPGGATSTNLKTAFTVLGYASPQKLSKDSVIESANHYKSKITKMVNDAIQEKQDKRNQIIANKETEKRSLLDEERSLKDQIINLQERLNQAQTSLGSIETKYSDELNELDKKISVGTIALRGVVGEINQVIETINTLQI